MLDSPLPTTPNHAKSERSIKHEAFPADDLGSGGPPLLLRTITRFAIRAIMKI